MEDLILVSKKTITVISTGGTIAMGVEPKTGGAVPLLSGEDLVKSMASLRNIARVDIMNFSNKPGTHLSMNDVLELAKVIQGLFKQKKADGVVITHGTDTLEETAYALDLLVQHDNPVVITGAMRNSSELSWDGPANLFNSILTAVSNVSRAKSVMVVFNNEIHLAREVTKANATQLNAFRSPLFGPVGVIYGERVQFVRTGGLREIIPAKEISAQVELIKFTLDMSDFLLESIRNSHLEGIVIEGAGVGHVSETCAEGIRALVDAGKVVILTSRCYEGVALQESYAFPGSEKDLRRIGAIVAPSLNGQKARIKLILALSYTRDLDRIRSIFNTPIEYG